MFIFLCYPEVCGSKAIDPAEFRDAKVAINSHTT